MDTGTTGPGDTDGGQSASPTNADLGGVADLEASLGSPAHDHVVEEELLLLLSVHTATLRLKAKPTRTLVGQTQ